ncbi:hypothetical protein GCM10010254_11740 [Streptomyces chromofuscus]|nr:hypothetical protein GCM10010254_11740 [Streptomyces chromofuscus]
MAGAHTAVRLVDGDADPSLLGDRRCEVGFDGPGPLHLFHTRRDLGLGEAPYRFPELVVLCSEIRIGHLWGSPS